MTAPDAASGSGSTTTRLVNVSKIVGKPTVFGGEADRWRDWRFTFEAWWSCLAANASDTLAQAVAHPDEIDATLSPPEVQELSRILYLVLTQTVKGRPLEILKGTLASNGFQMVKHLNIV